MNKKDKTEINFWRNAIKKLKSDYGVCCKGSDLDDFPEMYKKPRDVFAPSRCISCRAKEVIEWLEEHIDLIRG